MANWAEIEENNKVIRVVVGDDNDADEGYKWLIDNLGGTWIKTSRSAAIRYNYAGIGYTYDPIDDAFISPAPCDHTELTLNELKRWECSACETASM